MKGLVKYIKDASISNLNYIEYGDVYNVLNAENVDYCACVVEVEQTARTLNMYEHTIRITIVDKLLPDGSNLLDVYDDCIRILSDLINYILAEYNISETYTVNYIDQDFADRLAGVYTSVRINDLSYFCDYDDQN